MSICRFKPCINTYSSEGYSEKITFVVITLRLVKAMSYS